MKKLLNFLYLTGVATVCGIVFAFVITLLFVIGDGSFQILNKIDYFVFLSKLSALFSSIILFSVLVVEHFF